MLHFGPIEPAGQVESIPNVHCCEQTGWPAWSTVSVQTPLVHSVDVLLTVVQAAPKEPAAGASAEDGGVLPEQAARATRQAATRWRMGR